MYVKHINFYYTIRLHVSTPMWSSSGLPFETRHQNAAYIIGIPFNVYKI